MVTMMMMIPFRLVALLSLWIPLFVDSFVIIRNGGHHRQLLVVLPLSADNTKAADFNWKEPTDKQKNSMDKYGMTPETSIEMLFDHLGQASDDDQVLNELTQGDEEGGQQWKDFLNNMKQLKETKMKKSKPAEESSLGEEENDEQMLP